MTNSGTNTGDIFDVKKVRRLVELMKEHDLAEIDLRQGEQRIRLRRGADPDIAMGQPNYAPLAGNYSGGGSSSGGVSGGNAAKPAVAPATEDRDQLIIKSPMVGTFYTAANPESPPFVKVGDHVGPESVVCIVEAMKVFNEIPAEMSGQVTAVLVESGEPVEFGQPLFKLNARK